MTAVPTVILPALGVSSRHYRRLEDTLRDRGHHVRTVELMLDDPRACPETGYHELVEGPIHEAVEEVREDTGGAVALIGHSIGGQLALLYAATHPAAVAAVALPASGTVHWRAYPRSRAMPYLAFTQAVGAVARIAGSWPGHHLRFGGHQPARLMRDWARLGRSGRFRPEGAPDAYEAALPDLDVPVLRLSLPGDDLAPPAAGDALVAATGATDVTRRDLEAHRFDRTPGHAGWLREPGPVVDAIASWLDGHFAD